MKLGHPLPLACAVASLLAVAPVAAYELTVELGEEVALGPDAPAEDVTATCSGETCLTTWRQCGEEECERVIDTRDAALSSSRDAVTLGDRGQSGIACAREGCLLWSRYRANGVALEWRTVSRDGLATGEPTSLTAARGEVACGDDACLAFVVQPGFEVVSLSWIDPATGEVTYTTELGRLSGPFALSCGAQACVFFRNTGAHIFELQSHDQRDTEARVYSVAQVACASETCSWLEIGDHGIHWYARFGEIRLEDGETTEHSVSPEGEVQGWLESTYEYEETNGDWANAPYRLACGPSGCLVLFQGSDTMELRALSPRFEEGRSGGPATPAGTLDALAIPVGPSWPISVAATAEPERFVLAYARPDESGTERAFVRTIDVTFPRTDDGGCGCRTFASRSRSGWLVVALALPLARRRRRS